MSGSLEDGVGQPPTCAAPGEAGWRSRALGVSRTRPLVAAVASRRMAVAATIIGAVAAMAVLVFYAVVIQGWGTPLP